jgi:hypothetical protein
MKRQGISMTQRTDEERSAILSRCIELEKNGGDVLEYLASQHYISPRATWINFQREMGRKSYEWTNGKPNQERSLKRMKKLTLENKKKAVQIAIDGGDPRPFLTGLGCKDAHGAWIRIRMDIKKADPETYAKLPARLPKTVQKPKPKEEKTAPVVVAEEPKEEPAPESPTLKKTAPMIKGFTVRCVENNFGRFFFDCNSNRLYWTTPTGEEVALSADAWKEFATDVLPTAMGILGVKL